MSAHLPVFVSLHYEVEVAAGVFVVYRGIGSDCRLFIGRGLIFC